MVAFSLIIGLIFLFIFLAYKVTGALLKGLVWLVFLVPIALVLWSLGLACCCTLLLIPVGIKLFMAGCRVLIS